MTRVTKLEMKGFKSFAKQTDILFGPDFNVILGPNGSGKSNVIDALCFVLGKSSAKGLRAEKSANLIYNGGKTKLPAKEGEVSIYFDNSQKIFPLPTPEVKVSRIVRPNGQSIYKINGKTHTRNEVLDFLYFAKINPDGYNIILQGDIVRLVEMSGEDRRRVIEQISDISIYEDKKQKALNELEKVEQSLREAQIILSERNSYLKDLAKEREQAMQYQEHELNAKSGRATLLSLSMNDKKTQLAGLTEKSLETKQKQDELQKVIDELKAQISERKKEVDTINKQIEAKGDAEQIAMHKEIEQLRVAVGTGKNKIQSTQDEILKVEGRIKHLESTKSELQEKIAEINRNVDSYATRKKQQETLYKSVRQKIEDLRKKYNLEGATVIEKQIEEIDKTIEGEQKKIDALREQQQEMLRTKDRLDLQIKNADEKIDKVTEVAKAHKNEIEQLKQKRVEFKKATVELSQVLNTDNSMAAQVANVRSRVHFLNEELAKLNARKASIQETLGGSIAIAKIIENKNKIGGVHGTISSLGTVDAKYAKALEVAAGNKIKAIVVDDDGVAEQCIQFLKKNQLGVATFLPLNKIKGAAATDDVTKNVAGSHGFAIDLIKFDKKYQKAFSHVFTNTVIVEDIGTARKIGIGTTRMVTLEGDLSEQSGAMQGGFRKGATTGLGFTQREVTEKFDKLNAELSDQQSILSRLEEEKLSNEEKIQSLREFKANLEGEIIKQEKSLHLDSDDLEMSKNLKIEFEKELVQVEKEYQKVINDISVVNRELAQLKIKRQGLKDQIQDLRNPAKLAELTTFEEQSRTLHEDIVKIDGELKHLTSQIQNILQPEFENTQRIIKQHEKEQSEFTTSLKETKTSIDAMSKQLKELEEKEAVFYKQFKEAFAKRTKLSEEIEKLEDKTIAKEEAIRDVERRSTVSSIEIAKLQAELSVLEEEFKQFEGAVLFVDKTIEEIKKIVSSAEGKLRAIGAVNMKAIEMYDRVAAEYDKLVEKKTILTNEKENVHMMINEIEVRKKDLFMNVFNRINENFQRIFKLLSTKGEAYLELETPEQPFEGGVTMKVKLSGKKFMDIRSLSGGEKTMTALAFIFAIQENEPAYFYIMDEVDAALDKHNAQKLAELVASYSKNAQYIVISHNDAVISEANILYGVSMEQETGTSKVVSLKL